MSPIIKELLDKLDEAYPDRATIMTNMTEIERERYLAQLEVINHIRLLTKKDK